MQEIFKDIPGYEGCYQVSNLGRVKSLERTSINCINVKYTTQELILRQALQGNKGKAQYFGVGLMKDGKVKSIRVHKLVAIAFLGHKPNGNTIVVDHIDNNPFNNRVDNLQLITHGENMSKRHKESLKTV